MPNGGSDCCGTCPFNRKNRGEAGYAHSRDAGSDHCEIRDLAIETAFWTYCANHPHHNRDLLRVPIGPVWVDGGGFPYGRKHWQPGPDTEEVRVEVLRLIALATAEPVEDYPAGFALIEAAIVQAGELGDPRFAAQLDRIRQFPASLKDGVSGQSFARAPARSAAFAVRSLHSILPLAEVTPFRTDTVRAVAATIDQSGDKAGLPVLADALQEAGCMHQAALDYLRSPDARTPNWVVDAILGRIAAPTG